MKMLSKLLVAGFLGCALSLSVMAQSEEEQLLKKNGECANKSDWNCSLETAEKLMKLKPGEAAYIAGRGQALFELNRFDEADADFLRTFVLAGKQTPFIQYFYGKISIARGNRKQATAFFTLAASDLNDPNHTKFQTASDIAKDPTKTDQDLREKYGSFFCRGAYKVDKESFAKAGKTVLTSIVEEQNLAALKQVLPCRFDLNKQNKDGSTALIYVAVLASNQEAFVKELIKYGADPNFTDSASGITALIMAVAAKPDKPEIVQALLNAGASPAAKDKEGHDPLFYAKTNGLTESTRLIQAALEKLPKSK